MKKHSSFAVTALVIAILALTLTFSRAQAVVLGGTLKFGQQSSTEPDSLDPADYGCSYVPILIEAQIYEGLTRWDSSGNVVPAIAASWKTSDSKSWTFSLRKDVFFQNGRQVKAQDFVFSLNRAKARNCWGFWGMFKSFTAVSDFKLKILLNEPYAELPTMLPLPLFSVVPAESAATLRNKPIGTGAFKFSTWVKTSQITLVRNGSYYDRKAYLKKLVFRFFPDSTKEYEAFTQGSLQVTEISPSAWAGVKSDPNVLGPNPYLTTLVFFDTKTYPSAKVRRALGMSINRADILTKQTWDYDIPSLATGMVNPGKPGFNDDDISVAYNPSQALALLNQAGWSDTNNDGVLDNGAGKKLTATVRLSSSGVYRSIQLAIKKALTNIGGLGAGLQVGTVNSPQVGTVNYSGWISDYPDPDDDLYPWLDPHGLLNDRSNYNNPTVAFKLERARSTADRTTRYTLQHDAEKIAVETDGVVLPFYRGGDTPLLKSTKVNDLVFVSGMWFPYFKDVWLTP